MSRNRLTGFRGLWCGVLLIILLLAACTAWADAPVPPVCLEPVQGEFFIPDCNSEGEFPDYRNDGTHYGYADDYWDGCSVWCAVQGLEKSARATSALSAQGEYDYSPANLLDGSRKTAWVEGVEGCGIGESITIERNMSIGEKENKITYDNLCVVNGYARDHQTWLENSRVKRLLFYADDQYVCDLLLLDTMFPQYFDLSGLKLVTDSDKTVTFRFIVADVWPGEKYQDTALTGIEFGFTTPNH